MTVIESRPRIGPVRTLPNAITVVRTVAAVALGLVAVAAQSLLLVVVAYSIYWVGDMLDGFVARRTGQETRIGAVLDIVSDRACTAVLCVGLVRLLPGITAVAVVFLLSFLVLDTMLSLVFLCWPGVVSPNYFHVVDHRVWVLNWSPTAKAANTAGVVAAVAFGAYNVALAVAVGVVAVKAWSAVAVVRLLEREGRV
jgi:CDP-diacylglycerol--glycerol-3-phosphate 3-phosphatidyltransferase